MGSPTGRTGYLGYPVVLHHHNLLVLLDIRLREHSRQK